MSTGSGPFYRATLAVDLVTPRVNENGYPTEDKHGVVHLMLTDDRLAALVAMVSAHVDVLSTQTTQTTPAAVGDDRASLTAMASADALRAVLNALDGWVSGGKDNHDGMGHRGESSPCWEVFHVTDYRRMVADAARECGLTELAAELDAAADGDR